MKRLASRVAPCFLPWAASLALRSLILLQIATAPLSADEIAGRVVGITDGDTLTLLVAGNRQVKIRLSEIDAPEKNNPMVLNPRQHCPASYLAKTS